ncbi:MAG: DUF6048 family protein, partial [Gillisia sp.]
EQDTIPFKEKYGLRVGVDLSKPLRTLLDDSYSGFEVLGDYRLYKNFFLAAEIGNEKRDFEGDNIAVTAKGSYIKLGADYNAYDNWAGMENMIYVGLRYGFSTFSQTLNRYEIYDRSTYFPPNINTSPSESTGLTASWAELVVGMKVELVNNLYLGLNAQLKRRISQTTPPNFDNLVIPGFNRTYDGSSFGVGYGYTLSYLIPLYKKARD